MNIWYENLRGEYHTGAIIQLQKENDTLEHLEKKESFLTGVSIRVGYWRSTAACKTSHRRIFIASMLSCLGFAIWYSSLYYYRQPPME